MTVMRGRIPAALALAAAALLPVACGGGDPAGEEVTANPDAPEGIEVANGRLMLPPVSGNPAAIYFDITNNAAQDVMIRSVSVPDSGIAMLHQTTSWNQRTAMEEVFQQPVPAGETVSFEPGGLHVMVSDLGDTMTAGSTAEVTLTFVGGDKISFPAEIRAAGDAR
jgi:copper(I)-binding protein